MFTSATPVSVAELAQLLIARKKEGKRTLLFLGSRTGGLFGNQAFYSDLHPFSLRELSELSEIEKFHEFRHILETLTKKDDIKDPAKEKLLEALLTHWLKEAAKREEDNYVANLVKSGFFDVIISTSTDSLLEDALGIQGMKQGENYAVINMSGAKADIHNIMATPCTIINIFGELTSGNYKTMTGKISWGGSQRLRMLLNAISDRDMLAIGYDPLWDGQVESVLLTKGELWYVNEELPEHNSMIGDVLEKNQGKYVVGLHYERFFRELYNFINNDSGLSMRQISRPLFIQSDGREGKKVITKNLVQKIYNIFRREDSIRRSNMQLEQNMINRTIDPRRRNVFISYSHRDKRYLDRLLVHLDPHMGNEKDLLDIWSDTRFQGGEKWHEEIQEAIATTKVAIFLVSADFLASKYIKEQELPPLLKAASAGEVTVLSILLSPCSISKSKLDRYHLMNNVSLTLSEMNEPEQAKVWMRTAHRLEELLFPTQ